MSTPRGESRRSQVAPFHVMDVWAAAAARQASHGDVVNLSAGQPSTPAPAPVLAAAARALRSQQLGYTVTPGLPELREAVAQHHSELVGSPVDAADVVVTTGASGAFTLVLLAALDAGDEVVMARPGYPAYRNAAEALGLRVVEVDTGPEHRLQPTVAALDALDRPPAALVVASPANPTGTIIPAAELAALARWCDEHGTLLVSDEIYHGLSYTDPASGLATSSAWEHSRESVVIGSASKYFSMTGWRLG